jgi:hypothetical protein
LSSAEGVVLVTAEISMSASGNFVPTMCLFLREIKNKDLLDDAPPDSTADYHPSGWIQKDIFQKWFHLCID